MPPDHRIAVCPGSYDPVTCGHLDVIGRAASVFDEVIVAVVNASVRKSKALFSAEERVEFIEDATSDLPNVRVEPFDILIVDFARRVGATAIVKGLRAMSDFEYEFVMNQLNRKLAPGIHTVYLMASSQYRFLSSNGVKEMATFGGDVTDLVPNGVAARLKDALDRRNRSE